MTPLINQLPNREFKKYLNRPEVQMEILLDLICQRLQLNKKREERLIDSYDNITNTIDIDLFFSELEVLMYPFGSRPIFTVVKPIGRDEYDLDFAVQIILLQNNLNPDELIDKLYEALDKGSLKGKLKKIRYGVRVIYQGDFHVDIMIGILSDYGRLRVPDSKKNRWVFRNPKGFINWFSSKYIANFQSIPIYDYYREYFPDKVKDLVGIHGRAETESIEPAKTYPEIQPISRIVQLIKRHRSKFFQKQNKYETKSIILTTLIGDNYRGEVSIYEGMSNFISRTQELLTHHSDFPFELINPADRSLPKSLQENLTDKWKEDTHHYLAFKKYITKLNTDWRLVHAQNTIKDKAIFLQKIFGENVVNDAYKKLNDRKKISGLPYDQGGLPVSSSNPSTLNDQAALAFMTKERKPYYGF